MAHFIHNPSALSLLSMTFESTASDIDEGLDHEGTPVVLHSLLKEDDTLAVERSRRGGILECSFNFLGCLDSFATQDVDAWILHSKNHFEQADPPNSSQCCFCVTKFGPLTSEEKADEWSVWSERMKHVAYHHVSGATLKKAQPDPDLLWRGRVLTLAKYRELLNPSQTMFDAYSPSREDRERRRTTFRR